MIGKVAKRLHHDDDAIDDDAESMAPTENKSPSPARHDDDHGQDNTLGSSPRR